MALFALTSSSSLVILLIGLLVCYLVAHRLYLHPLSKIPGPRLAALTSLYEFYYDCILGGKFVFKLTELHACYGPIVRISPTEVHIDDPSYFDALYNVAGKLDKDKWYYSFIGSQDAGFGTSNVDLHRARRRAMSKFFSTSAISNLETSSIKNVEALCRRLGEFCRDTKAVNLSNAYRCLAADSVTGYCMPEPFHLLESIDFAQDYNRQARTISWIAVWHRHIPVILPIFMAMPSWFVKLTSSEGGRLAFDFQSGLARQATDVVNATKRNDRSVLEGIVNSDLPEDEKTADRLTQEARTLVGAGSETTGATLETITYFVLENPAVKAKLKTELMDTASQGISLTSSEVLKQLPYLTAVIKEGLRITNAVSGRLSRVDPKHEHMYDSYILPAGTAMSMSLTSLHMHTETFPDPAEFRPERWLDDANSKTLEKNFAPFSRGARSCIGKELAMMNLYLMVASFFYRFDAELYETTYDDIAMKHDFFAPFPSKDSNGLKVMLKHQTT